MKDIGRMNSTDYGILKFAYGCNKLIKIHFHALLQNGTNHYDKEFDSKLIIMEINYGNTV